MLRRGTEDTTPTNAAALTGLIHDHEAQSEVCCSRITRQGTPQEVLTDDDGRSVTNSGTVPTASKVAWQTSS